MEPASIYNIISCVVYLFPEALDTPPTENEWKTPSDCSGDECDYKISWVVREQDGEVDFHIRAKQSITQWTGVGFTKGTKMVRHAMHVA